MVLKEYLISFDEIHLNLMKKGILLTCAVLMTLIVAKAQSLSLIDPVSTVVGTLAELGTNGELVADWSVQNISNNALSVRASRNVISEVAGSENYFCWGVCFTSEVNISPAQIAQQMPAGSTNDTFYAHYRANGYAGQTEVEYCFFDANNTADRSCHRVLYCVDVAECVVSVSELDSESTNLEIFPNALSGLGKISYSLPLGLRKGQIDIFSTTGQLVKSVQLNSREGLVLIHGSDFANGTYMVRLSSADVVHQFSRLLIAQ